MKWLQTPLLPLPLPPSLNINVNKITLSVITYAQKPLDWLVNRRNAFQSTRKFRIQPLFYCRWFYTGTY